MQSQTLHEETSNGFWRGLLTDWFSILTEPNLDRFRIQKTKSDILKAVVGIGIFGLVFALWSLIFHPATMPISTGNAFLDLLLVMFFAEADFFILSLIFYVIAKAFGGHGNFADQSYLLSLVLPQWASSSSLSYLSAITWA